MLISSAGIHPFCTDVLIHKSRDNNINPLVGEAYSSDSLISVCEVLQRQALRGRTISSSSIFHLTCLFSTLEITKQHCCS